MSVSEAREGEVEQPTRHTNGTGRVREDGEPGYYLVSKTANKCERIRYGLPVYESNSRVDGCSMNTCRGAAEMTNKITLPMKTLATGVLSEMGAAGSARNFNHAVRNC